LPFCKFWQLFLEKKITRKICNILTQVFNFGQFSTFWIHHLLFGEIFSPNFNLKNVILDLYKLQTIFHEESGPYHQIDGRIKFFQNFDMYCKAKFRKKKTFLDDPHFDYTNLVKRSQLVRVSYNCVTNYANCFFQWSFTGKKNRTHTLASNVLITIS
jgi:hypothetical protein